MVQTILITVFIVAVWALLARRLTRWTFSAPLVMVLAGLTVGLVSNNDVGFAAFINTDITRQVCELILAVLLFVDAMEVKPERRTRTRGPALRLLLIALPISIVLAVVLGWLLPLDLPLAVLLAVACIAMPTDFSPTTSIVKNVKLPARVREILNLESGYNDGIVAPFFVFALALAGDLSHSSSPEEALRQAIPAMLIAIVVGAGIGWLYAKGLKLARSHIWLDAQSARIGVFVLPILTYAVAVSLTGNGFVAAFVCGIVFAKYYGAERFEADTSLVEDINIFSNLLLWFIFGAVCVLVFQENQDLEILPVILFALLALTVLRIVPVLVSLWRSDLRFSERLIIGTLGPRGTASIVFGLLAFNALPDEWAYPVLLVTVLVVFLSIFLHGLGSHAIIMIFDRSERRGSIGQIENH